MSELCLIRHGQTDWNQQRRFQGQSDVPLNGTGLDQACALAESLAGQTFTALYSSDLSRALDTARALAAREGLEVQPLPELRERHYGIFQGITAAEGAAQSAEKTARNNATVAELAELVAQVSE